MIVVDTNIVAYFFIEGERTAAARALRQVEPGWRLPPLWRHEYLNVLATYTRSGGTDIDTACTLWHTAAALFADSEQDVDMTAALALATTHGISAYDAQFVSLAQVLNVRLVTEDCRLLKIFPERAIPLSSISGDLSTA